MKKRQTLDEQFDSISQKIADELAKTSVLTKSKAAVNALNHATLALEKLAIHMASMEFGDERFCEACGRKGISADAAGKTLAYLAKVVNEQARLLEYAKGKPDSRTEVTGLADLMRLLDPQEFETVSKIIDTASERMKRLEQTSGTA